MTADLAYQEFLRAKAQDGTDCGFAPVGLPAFLFDYQRALVEWALRKGRAALFCDCGLGKTPMFLVWAENVVQHTGGAVLVITPLAVAAQTLREAHKFGIEARRSSNGQAHPGITVTNYERLHHFNPSDFVGVVCDESSAIKSFNGKRRALVTEFLRTIPYRLLDTATAAPNDYVELGTSSEALGQLGHVDMLNRFFANDQNTSDLTRKWRLQSGRGGDGKWRFKGHAEEAFWRWVCSWARAMRKPSDLGFSDEGHSLPPLVEREHVISARTDAPGWLPGFSRPAANMEEEREERRRTIPERCEIAASLVADTGQPFVIWCHLNAEGKRLAEMIPGAVEVSGSDSDEAKEEAYEAFVSGQIRGIVTKPKIGAWGLNWQHCAHVVTFASHSYEQYYQGVRRCWRYGQTREVVVDLVATEGERGVKDNLRRKAEAADRMFSALVQHMNDALRIDARTNYSTPVEVPSWL